MGGLGWEIIFLRILFLFYSSYLRFIIFPFRIFVQLEIFSSSSSLSWDFHLLRDLKDDEVNELSLLLGSLESVKLVEKDDDIMVWDVDPSSVFSFKAFYESFFPICGFPLFLSSTKG